MAPIVAAAQTEVEKVEVRANPVLPSNVSSNEPIDVVTAADIDRTGAADLGQYLARLPELGSQGVTAANADGYGAEFIDLRNLNFNRTLTLVDGQRFVTSGIRTDEAVDLNDIPLPLIDHVEILADGSQPEWGPDAVAGTVNIVLKHSLDGIRLDAEGGTTSGGGAATEQVTLTAGHSFGNVSLIGSVGYDNRDPLLQSDRAFSRNPIASATVGTPPVIGSPATPGGHATNSDGTLDALLLGGGEYRPYDPLADGYVDTAQRDLTGGTRRIRADGLLRWDVTPDTTADVQMLWTERRTDQLAPPQALGLSGTDRYPQGFDVGADAPGNPFGQAVLLERTLTEAGPQLTTTEGSTWRMLADLRGRLGSVDWTIAYNHGDSALRYTTRNAIDLTDVFGSIAGGADYFGPSTLSPATVDAIRYRDGSESRYSEDVARGTAVAPLFRLPGGMMETTVGAEFRAEHGQTSVDPVVLAGDQAGGDAAPTSGGWTSNDAFIDFDLPFLKDAPWARALQGEASARISDTNRYSTLYTWKALLGWTPNRTIRFRATMGLARRPPAITEAFGGSTATEVAATDPCDSVNGELGNPTVARNCAASGLSPDFRQSSALVAVENGGNPHLRAEASQSMTLGVVVTPPAIPNLALTADWYDYSIKNAIDQLDDTDPNDIADGCYESANLSSPSCALIARSPAGAGKGQIENILALDENIGTIKTSGIDLDLSYAHPLAGGHVSLDWRTTWLLDWRIREIGSAGFTQYAGTIPGLVDVGSYTRIRSFASVDYSRGRWNASWQGRLIGGARLQDASPGTPFTKTGPLLYQDVSVGRRIGRLLLTAGVDNLLDVQPPTFVDGVTNTDVNTYDVLGRFVYARLAVSL